MVMKEAPLKGANIKKMVAKLEIIQGFKTFLDSNKTCLQQVSNLCNRDMCEKKNYSNLK